MSAAHTPGPNATLFAAVHRIWRAQVRKATADAVWAGLAFSEVQPMARAAIAKATGGAQ